MGDGADRERWSDERLLRATAACDGDAFGVFYRRHLQGVVGFLLRETRDRELTADLTAEVFSTALGSAHRYRADRETALPWVLGIARNVLYASWRRRQVEDRGRRRLNFEPLDLEDDDLERTESMVDAEAGGKAMVLLEALPVNEREAVRSRVVDELPYPEIALRMRCSEMVVRKRVSRGLGRLRTQVMRGDV